MLRTQVYLPEEFHAQLNELAVRLERPMAAIIREMLKNGLENKEELIGKGNDLWELAGITIKGGPKDLSKKLNQYLYG